MKPPKLHPLLLNCCDRVNKLLEYVGFATDTMENSEELLLEMAETKKRRREFEERLQPTSRNPKVDRSEDARLPWTRTGWQGHMEAKVRANEWHEYYHMPVATFTKLHDLLFRESPKEKARSIQQGSNSTRMGYIDTHVKLACCIRELFGEKRKSMVDVFKISKSSARVSFLDVITRIN